MIRPLLIGMVAGQRSMTPLAAAALSVGSRPDHATGSPAIVGRPWAQAGALLIALGELLGDKMKSAPDRTVPAGLAARLITGAIAGAALGPRDDRVRAGLLGMIGAVGASYVGLALRKRAMARYGQTPSGAVEDGLVLIATALLFTTRPRR